MRWRTRPWALLLLASPVMAQSTPSFILHDGVGRTVTLGAPPSAVSATGAPVISPAGPAATERYMVLGCRFAGVSGEPATMAALGEVLSATSPGLGHYFSEISGGGFTLLGSTAPAWANLPRTAADYDVSVSDNAVQLYQDCIGAHDPVVDFSQADGVFMVMNGELVGPGFFRSFSSQSTISVTTADGTRALRLVFLSASAATNRFLWAHGLGHTYGLRHSSGQPLSSTNSLWDMMAKGGYVASGVPGRVPVHPKAVDKVLLGWTPESRVYIPVVGSDQRITLERSAQPPSTANPVIVRIPIGTNYYTVETRRVAGYDQVADSALAGEGVLVHSVIPTQTDPLAEIYDADGNSNPNDAGGYLGVGESFIDTVNRVRVEVTGLTTTGFEVRVCLQAAATGQYGDVNGDGAVNVIDAQIVARFSVGLSVPDATLAQARGDANGDGAINVIDAQVIARFAVGLSTTGAQVGQPAGGC